MIPIRLIGPKVLVALEPKATEIEDSTGMHYHDKGQTESGVILAQPTDMYDQDAHSRGLVVALGEKRSTVELDDVKRIIQQCDRVTGEVLARLDRLPGAAFAVSEGDVVLFPPTAGVSLGEQDDGITYVVLFETDVLAIVDPKVEAVA